MPLTGQQIQQLVSVIVAESNTQRLAILATALGTQLVQGVDLRSQAYSLIMELNSQRPSQDRELLQQLRSFDNQAIRSLAMTLLQPAYFPPDDAHDALLLGQVAFIGRTLLRESIREFTSPQLDSTTHVLIVSGGKPGGKSHTWQFLRHLARNVAGVEPTRLPLEGTNYTPRQFLGQAMMLLGLGDNAGLPELTDNPQLARTSPLLNAFKGRLVDIKKPYWLVIDDLNDPSIRDEIRETAYALAYVVEEIKPPNLWLALLGYNAAIQDRELTYVARDEATFPAPSTVADFLKKVADASNANLSKERATEIATVMFQGFTTVDKEAMSLLGTRIEAACKQLKRGVLP